jgi:hypothetical protein
MFKKAKLNRIAIAVAMSISLTGIAQAQSTSSDIRGMITTPTGSPAANTKIIIKHIPSGTVKEMETNAQGAFIAKGLRVGGPYEVVIDSDVHKDATVTNVFLNLGETYRLVQRLESDNVERIQVTGTATVFDATGARSSYGQEEIARMPSFNRDLKDIVRNNPLAVVDASGDLSVGGQNSKFNSITVDGIGQNDDFGLNSGGYPAQRSPISLDAVEQISIDTTPFNTRQGGFSGGIINVVTKSGTNTFKGSTFYEFKNDNFSGDPENKRTDEDPQFNSDAPVENFATGKESTYGISYSGPIPL